MSRFARWRRTTLARSAGPVSPRHGPTTSIDTTIDPTERWEPGAVVAGVYEVHEQLGSGGLGVVHRVRHREWGVDLAVKSPRLDGPADGQVLAALVNEASAWVDLPAHEHVCSCHYVRVLAGAPRIVAEYVDGGSVADAVRAGRLNSAATILDVAIQMAWGIQVAHDAGFVHQDVKPANALITSAGTVKITDFGLARAARRTELSSTTGPSPEAVSTMSVTALGLTPAYASPEQADGRRIGPGSDAWSWAVSVLELFVGRVTWAAGPTAAVALEAYRRGPPQGRPALPPPVAALLTECLSDDPAERPSAMAEIARRLIDAYSSAFDEPYRRRAADTATHVADGLNNKALSLIDLGRRDEAAAVWDQALRTDPRHVDSSFNTGLLKWRAGETTDLQLIDQLTPLRNVHSGSTRAGICRLIASVHVERGDREAAIEQLNEASSITPGDPLVAAARQLAKSLPRTVRPIALPRPDNYRASATALSTEADLAVTVDEPGIVQWWDTRDGRRRARVAETDADAIGAVATTPAGDLVATGGHDRTVRLWRPSTGCVGRLHDAGSSVPAVALSRDGRYVLASTSRGEVIRWDLTSGGFHRLQKAFVLREWVDHVPWRAALTDDARFAVVITHTGVIHWWDCTGPKPRSTVFDRVTGALTDLRLLAVSADGQLAAMADRHGTVELWEPATGRRTATFSTASLEPSMGNGAHSLAITSDGRYALCGDNHARVRVWDVVERRCRRTVVGPQNAWSLVVQHDRDVLACDDVRTVRRWSLAAGPFAHLRYSAPQGVEQLSDHATEVQALADDARALSAGGDHASAADRLRRARTIPGFERDPTLLEIWRQVGFHGHRTDLVDCRHIRDVMRAAAGDKLIAMAMTPDATRVLVGHRDATLSYVDLTTGSLVRELDPRSPGTRGAKAGDAAPSERAASIAVTADGTHGLVGSFDGVVRWWDLTEGRCHTELIGHSENITAVAVTGDGRRAVSGARDGTFRSWDLTRGSCVGTAPIVVNALAITGDGRHAVIGGRDNLLVWNVETGRCDHTLDGHRGVIMSVSVTADGSRGLSSDEDGNVRFWDLQQGRCVRALDGKSPGRGYVYVALSADGRTALTHQIRLRGSGSIDRPMWRWWDAETGRCLHTTAVDGDDLALSADASHALSFSAGTVSLWEAVWDYAFPPGANDA